ncbi:hypothetical protein GIB67_030880 [Kingdonia uniflora]|uniref:Chalcone isomerase n=1 Tax=Kingdonia uniflora TaxID=39325 RepID=A0A7J7L3B0_9MAGN|nr:hypothetical protein GIB67_030880 [Kingdonia uniflora]
MATMVQGVTTKTEMLEIDPKSTIGTSKDATMVNDVAKMEHEGKTNEDETLKKGSETTKKDVKKGLNETPEGETSTIEKDLKADVELKKEKADDTAVEDETDKKEAVAEQTEPKTGVSFPVKLRDGKQLNSFGMRKKTILGLGIKIYGFGMYADNEKLKDILRSKIGKAPAKPTKEMYQAVIDSDAGMVVKLVIVFGSLTMNMVKKNFDEGLGASIKKLNGGQKDGELTNKVMGEASDSIKLTAGSVIEISRLPGYVLQTKVKDEVVSTVESELLCRAYINMYLGDDSFDKEAKERFGVSLMSLF